MKQKYDSVDAYRIYVFNRIMTLAPIIGIAAAGTFTLSRLRGYFAFVDTTYLICFDVVCLSYFLVAFLIKRSGIVRKGAVDSKQLMVVDLVLGLLVLLQWNLISYIFPAREFWGYAPMFVLLTAFMFRSRAVLAQILGISLSIAVSWIIMGDRLLPEDDATFLLYISMRIVALVISFIVIYALTCFAEKFTSLVKENQQDMARQNEKLEKMGQDIITFTADIIEERDSTSGSHVKRLKSYTRILATQIAENCPKYGLDEEKIDKISEACILHDVGKIAIPDSILLKPGRLTPEEFEIIKTHTTKGAAIIEKLPDSIDDEYRRYCREICLFHHEKYDGGGYPTGLKGEDIPISAQIVSVVDCYDALSNERPYKRALPGEAAINMILGGECGVFSEQMKTCIEACREKLLNA